MRVAWCLKVSTSMAARAARLHRTKHPSSVGSPQRLPRRESNRNWNELACLACFTGSPDCRVHYEEILLKTSTNSEMSLSLESFQNSAQGKQLRRRSGADIRSGRRDVCNFDPA